VAWDGRSPSLTGEKSIYLRFQPLRLPLGALQGLERLCGGRLLTVEAVLVGACHLRSGSLLPLVLSVSSGVLSARTKQTKEPAGATPAGSEILPLSARDRGA
jgi:hypothetical protein